MVFYAKYFQLLILENGFAKQGSCLEFSYPIAPNSPNPLQYDADGAAQGMYV